MTVRIPEIVAFENSGPRKPKKKIPTSGELIAGSKLRVKWEPKETTIFYPLEKVTIDIQGLLSKLPSVSNNQIQRAGIKKDGTAFLRVQKNPEHQMIFLALTKMWNQFCALSGRRLNFEDNKDSRLRCILLLGERCNAMDSHNIPKGICDWFQDEKIQLINNDRNMQVIAEHKKNLKHLTFLNPLTTTIVIAREGVASKQFNNLVRTMLGQPHEDLV